VPYYRCPACGLMSHSVAVYSTAGVCANCSAELPEDAKLHVVTDSPARLQRSFRAGLEAPAQARRAVSGLPLSEPVRDQLALLVSELVTNSLRHAGLAAGDPIELEVSSENGHVWVSVRDDGPGFSPPAQVADPGPNGGFGLAILTSVAREWGVDSGAEGCTVWCAVDAAAAAAMPMRQRA
jgi:anti-sigma regulatory factor (Ser/Thr protein kinase)